MKAVIQHSNNFPERNIDISLNVSAHNVSFSHLHPCNCLFFKLHRFPRKEIIQQIRQKECGEVSQIKAFVRVCIKKQRTDLCLIVRYSIRTAGASKNQHVITEKEKVYIIRPEKQELIDFVRPYLSRLYEFNEKQNADLLKHYFDEYVEPSSLSSIASRITREDEKKAAKMLAAYFGF